MRRIISFSILAFALITFICSCGKGVIYSEYKSIGSAQGWKIKDKIVFEVEVKDNSVPYDFFVNVRQGDAYPYRNLFLFLTTEYPDGHLKLDTLECLLSDEKNRWLGEGAGDVWDNHILFKHNVQFPAAGKYKFHYEHGMRNDPLPAVMDVGITLQKAE